MDIELNEYVEKEEFERMYREAKTAEEKRAISFCEIVTNCLTRFRGWPASKEGTNDDKEKVFGALEKKRLYFSTALGYNDPFDTLLYYDRDKFLQNIFEVIGSNPAPAHT